MKTGFSAEALRAGINIQKKRLKKLSFRLKVKLFLTVILPGLAALLALQTVKTFLRIYLRDSASSAAMDGGDASQTPMEPEPVTLEMSPPDFITPKPVKSEIVWQSAGQKTPR